MERNGQRDDWGVEAVSFQPSAISRIVGAEVWVKVSAPGDPPPSDPGELTFLLLSTRTPAVADRPAPDGGMPAPHMVRSLSSRGDAGPWSETASATIGA